MGCTNNCDQKCTYRNSAFMHSSDFSSAYSTISFVVPQIPVADFSMSMRISISSCTNSTTRSLYLLLYILRATTSMEQVMRTFKQAGCPHNNRSGQRACCAEQQASGTTRKKTLARAPSQPATAPCPPHRGTTSTLQASGIGGRQ